MSELQCYPKDEMDFIEKKLIWDFVNDNKFDIIVYIICIIFTYPIVSVILSNFFSDLIESINKKDFKIQKQIFTQNYTKTPKGIFSKILVLFLVTGFMTQITFHYEKILFPNYLLFLNSTLRKGLLEGSRTQFREINVAETLTRISDVVYDLESLLKDTSNKLIPFFLKLSVVNLFYLTINKIYFATGIIFDFIRFYFLKSFSNRYQNASQNKFEIFFKNSEEFSNKFDNFLHIVINDNIEEEVDNLKDLSQKLKNTIQTQMDEKKTFMRFFSVFSVFVFFIKFYILFDLLKKKLVHKKSFIIILFLEFSYLSEWNDIIYNYINILNTYEGIKNSRFELYKILCYNDENKNLITPNITNGKIEIKNLTFSYYQNTDDKKIFDQYSYTFEDQSKTVLKGKSGSGKSTLIDLILKLKIIQSGEILIGGVNIKEISNYSLRKIVIMIPQRNTLFANMTVKQNLLYGSQISKENIKLMNGLLDRYPNLKNIIKQNDPTFLDKKIEKSNTSGGQIRAILNFRGILRSILNQDSRIVILDEPFAALSPEGVDDTVNMITTELESKTVIIIDHQLHKKNGEWYSQDHKLNENFAYIEYDIGNRYK